MRKLIALTICMLLLIGSPASAAGASQADRSYEAETIARSAAGAGYIADEPEQIVPGELGASEEDYEAEEPAASIASEADLESRIAAASGSDYESWSIAGDVTISGQYALPDMITLIVPSGASLSLSGGSRLTFPSESYLYIAGGACAVRSGAEIAGDGAYGAYVYVESGALTVESGASLLGTIDGVRNAASIAIDDMSVVCWIDDYTIDTVDELYALLDSPLWTPEDGSSVMHGVTCSGSVVLTKDLTIPADTWLANEAAFSVPAGIALTVAQSANLSVRSELSVEGKLVNNGVIGCIRPLSMLTLAEGGEYEGTGTIMAYRGKIAGFDGLGADVIYLDGDDRIEIADEGQLIALIGEGEPENYAEWFIIGHLTVTQDLVIPQNVVLHLESGCSLTLGNGAALAVSEFMYVYGTLTVDSGAKLEIGRAYMGPEGVLSVQSGGELIFTWESPGIVAELGAAITGVEPSKVMWEESIQADTAAELKAALEKPLYIPPEGSAFRRHIYCGGEMTLAEDVFIPGAVQVSFSAPVTVEESADVTLQTGACVDVWNTTMTVRGALVNDGNIYVEDGASFALVAPGTYSGAGKVYGYRDQIFGMEDANVVYWESGGDTEITTEAQMVALADAGGPGEYAVWRICSDITITQDVVIPENVFFYVESGCTLTIGDEASLTVLEFLGHFGTIEVLPGGTLTLDSNKMNPSSVLNIQKGGELLFMHDYNIVSADFGAVITGVKKTKIRWEPEFVVASQDAWNDLMGTTFVSEHQGSSVWYTINLQDANLVLPSDWTLPACASLVINQRSVLTIPAGRKLTVFGCVYVYGKMYVAGTLVNNGTGYPAGTTVMACGIRVQESGILNLLEGGAYEGKGSFYVAGTIDGFKFPQLVSANTKGTAIDKVNSISENVNQMYAHNVADAIAADGNLLKYRVLAADGSAIENIMLDVVYDMGTHAQVASISGDAFSIKLEDGFKQAAFYVNIYAGTSYADREFLSSMKLTISNSDYCDYTISLQGSSSQKCRTCPPGALESYYDCVLAFGRDLSAFEAVFDICFDGVKITSEDVSSVSFEHQYDRAITLAAGSDVGTFSVSTELFSFYDPIYITLNKTDGTSSKIAFALAGYPSLQQTMTVGGKANCPISFCSNEDYRPINGWEFSYNGHGTSSAEVYLCADRGSEYVDSERYVKVEDLDEVQSVNYTLYGADGTGITWDSCPGLDGCYQVRLPEGLSGSHSVDILATVELKDGGRVYGVISISFTLNTSTHIFTIEEDYPGTLQAYLDNLRVDPDYNLPASVNVNRTFVENISTNRWICLSGSGTLRGSIYCSGSYMGIFLPLLAPAENALDYGIMVGNTRNIQINDKTTIDGFNIGVCAPNGRGSVVSENAEISNCGIGVLSVLNDRSYNEIRETLFSGNQTALMIFREYGTQEIRKCSFINIPAGGLIAVNKGSGTLDMRYNYFEIPVGRTLAELFHGDNINYSVYYADAAMTTLALASVVAEPGGTVAAAIDKEYADAPIGSIVFEELAAAGTGSGTANTLELSVVSVDGEGNETTNVAWTFQSDAINENPNDLYLGVSDTASGDAQDVLDEYGALENMQTVNFRQEGDLPGAADVTIPAPEDILRQDELYLYLIDTDSGELVLQSNRVSVDAQAGTVTIEDLTHCSEYIITNELLDVLYGDVNYDGLVNIADAIALCRFVSLRDTYTASEFVAGDVDADGVLSVVDIVHICKYILGMESKLPRQLEDEGWGPSIP